MEKKWWIMIIVALIVVGAIVFFAARNEVAVPSADLCTAHEEKNFTCVKSENGDYFNIPRKIGGDCRIDRTIPENDSRVVACGNITDACVDGRRGCCEENKVFDQCEGDLLVLKFENSCTKKTIEQKVDCSLQKGQYFNSSLSCFKKTGVKEGKPWEQNVCLEKCQGKVFCNKWKVYNPCSEDGFGIDWTQNLPSCPDGQQCVLLDGMYGYCQ